MLGQAAAMLIPLPTAVTLELDERPLSFSLHEMRALAGPPAPVLDADRPASVPRPGGELFRDRTAAVQGPRHWLAIDCSHAVPGSMGGGPERGRGASGGRLEAGCPPQRETTAVVGGVYGRSGAGARLADHGGRGSSGSIVAVGGGRGHALPPGNAVVVVEGAQGDGV